MSFSMQMTCQTKPKTEKKMQEAMDRVSQACDNYDSQSARKRLVLLYQPTPGKSYNEPGITMNGQRLQAVDFT